MKRLLRFSGLLSLVFLSLPLILSCGNSNGNSESSAGRPALSIPGDYQLGTNHIVGFEFNLSEPVLITALGTIKPVGEYFDGMESINIDDVQGSVAVALYNSGGIKIQEVNITPASELIEGYRYEALPSPLELLAGNYYILGVYGDEEYFGFSQTGDSPLYDSRVSFVRMQEKNNPSEGVPTTPPGSPNGWSNQYYNVNFLIAN